MKEKTPDKDFDLNTWNNMPEQVVKLTEDELTGILKKFQKNEDFVLKVSIKRNNSKA